MSRTRSQRPSIGSSSPKRPIAVAKVATMVGAVALAAALTGCGAGQISQTANQASAINGASANLGKLTLRNVYLAGSNDPVKQRAGQKAELVLVVTNESPDVPDTLTSITSPDGVGAVTLSGDAEIPAAGRLFVGADHESTPEGKSAVAAAARSGTPNAELAADTIKQGNAEVQLDKDLADGLTYRFTFSFQKSGTVTIAVPIDAGPNAPREHTGDAGHEGGEH